MTARLVRCPPMVRRLALPRHRAWSLALVPVAAVLALLAPSCGPAPTNSFSYSGITQQPYSVTEAQGEMVGGKLYSFGGFDSIKACCTPTDRAYKYTPGAGWTALHNMPTKGVTHAGMATDGTNIFYAGGYIANAAWTGQIFGTKAVWRYNVGANSYTQLPDLPVERAGGQLEYLNGWLHFFGGTNKARTEDVADHWALQLSNQGAGWQRRASISNGRHHMGSAVLNGRIYAIGGQHHHDAQLVTQNTVESYDPGSNTWTLRASIPKARGHISSTTFVLSGRIVVAGGETSSGVRIADVNAYDPGCNCWASLTPLPSAKASGVGGPVGDGFLYTGGGWRGGWRATPA
jgi:N-acetylneuraminic acid mutarotase